MRRGVQFLTTAFLLLTACRAPHYYTRNLKPYRVEQSKLTSSFKGHEVSKDDFISLILQKVCLSDFPDAFGGGVGVIAGAEIEGLEFFDEATGKWAARSVKRTINSIGAYSHGCVNFAHFGLGEYRYRDNRIHFKLTLRRLENQEQKRFADELFASGKTALGVVAASGAAAALPVANILYTALMQQQVAEAVVLDFSFDLHPVSTGGEIPLVPRVGQMVILGEVADDRWFSFKKAKRPTADALSPVTVTPAGELEVAGAQYTDAFYATIAIARLHRNPMLLRGLETLEDVLLDNAFNGVATPEAAIAASSRLKDFYDAAIVRNDFSPAEKTYLSAMTKCTEAWRTKYYVLPPTLLALADVTAGQREQISGALAQVGTECTDFDALTQEHSGDKDKAMSRLCGIDPVNGGSGFVPTCAEYRISVASKRYRASVGAALASLESRDSQIAQLRAQSVALESELKNKRVDLDKLYTQLADGGLDVKNIKESLAQYRERAEAAKTLAGRFVALKKAVDATGLDGPGVVVRKNRPTLVVPGEILFDSGSYELNESGASVLSKLAKGIREAPGLAERTYQVAGHTDNQPIAPAAALLDNWHLSMMRARSVVLFLIRPVAQGGGGLDPSRISAAGFGDLDPVTDNSTPTLRAKNRRVEVIMVPELSELLAAQDLQAE